MVSQMKISDYRDESENRFRSLQVYLQTFNLMICNVDRNVPRRIELQEWSGHLLKPVQLYFAHVHQSHEGRKRHLQRPFHSKDLTKLAILRDQKCPTLTRPQSYPQMLCIALRARQSRTLLIPEDGYFCKIFRIKGSQKVKLLTVMTLSYMRTNAMYAYVHFCTPRSVCQFC